MNKTKLGLLLIVLAIITVLTPIVGVYANRIMNATGGESFAITVSCVVLMCFCGAFFIFLTDKK